MEKHYHACGWCASNDFEVLFEGNDLLEGLEGTFQLTKCKSCGLYQQNPRLSPEELATYYPDNYSAYLPLLKAIKKTGDRRDKQYGLWKRLKLVEKYVDSGNWLDVGCGSGRLFEYAQSKNKWNLVGLEPNKKMALATRENLGIEVINTSFESFAYGASSFDLVSMWDVLEHLPYPVEAIEKVSVLLKPNAIFVLSIPNMGSIHRKLFGQYWSGYDLPRHLFLFSGNLLEKVFNKYGFVILEKKCVAGSFSSFMLDLTFWARATQKQKLEFVLTKLTNSVFFRLLTFPFFWVLDKLRLSSHITIVAKNVKK